MYCVKCGVRLQDGYEKCPLCETPVWNPEGVHHAEPVYPPESFPERLDKRRHAIAFAITMLCCAAGISIFMICKSLYPDMGWCGVAEFALVLFYIVMILPSWFRKPNPVVFLPIGHAAAAGYLYYLCVYTKGHWFVSFAMPIVLMSMLITETFAALIRYVRGGRYYICGGVSLLIGGMMILTEFFEHLTFNTAMFAWSPYAAGACAVIGIVLILAGIIRPMREFFNRLFFV